PGLPHRAPLLVAEAKQPLQCHEVRFGLHELRELRPPERVPLVAGRLQQPARRRRSVTTDQTARDHAERLGLVAPLATVSGLRKRSRHRKSPSKTPRRTRTAAKS